MANSAAVLPASLAGPDAAPSRVPRLPFRPGLDGVRGLAVIVVVVNHLHPTLAPGGFLGVDLFFVLSGYLITSLLVGELDSTGRVRLSGFWSRRGRRLLPALYAVLLGVAVASRYLLPAWQRAGVRGDEGAALFYVSNWRFIFSGQQYFDSAGAPSPLLHLWSLAIEEQAYLIWPLIVLAAWRLGGRRKAVVGATAAVLAAASALAMIAAGPGNATYLATHTRAQAILIGALAAVAVPMVRDAMPARRGWAWAALGVVSLVVLGAMVGLVDSTDTWMYRGGFTLAAIASIGLVLASSADGWVARACAFGPLRAVGLVSYGVYVIHWPVLVFVTEGRTGLSGRALDAVRLGLIGVLTVVSYRLIEQPVRRGRLTTSAARWVAPLALGTTALVIVVAGLGAIAPPAYLQQNTAAGPVGAAATSIVPLPSTTTLPPVAGPTTSGSGPTTSAPPPVPRRLTLVGDSIATSLYPGVAAAGEQRGVHVVDRSFAGCGVVSNSVPAQEDGTAVAWGKDCQTGIPSLQEQARLDGSDAVLILSTWEAGFRLEGGRFLRPGTAAWRASIRRGLEETVDRVGAGGARVVFVGAAPAVPGLMRTSSPEVRAENAAYVALVRSFAQEHGYGWVDLAPAVCNGHPSACPVELDGVRIRPDDGNHFSPKGSATVGPAALDAILAAVTGRT